MFKLCVLAVVLFRAHATVLFASLGDNVTLLCFFDSEANYLSWYKQVAGDKPEIILSYYVYLANSHSHQKMGVVSERLTAHQGANFFHLNISGVELSDTAVYYCGQTHLTVTSFDNGIFLLVKESSRLSVSQRPTSISATKGGSAALQCTTHPGISNGHHRVYWFREASRDSCLGMTYVHSENSSMCAKVSERRCVYMLSKKDVTLADAGLYYCAVASCGEIVFGEGTRLDVGGQTHTWLTPCLIATLLLSIFLNILLALVCKKSRRQQLLQDGANMQTSVLEDNVDDEIGDALPYVTLDFKKRQSNSRRQRSPENTIYTGVRLKHVD
ncbi:uncharacterized protein [Nerophis lumbriciformis]|uniref:uncharacterized protein n=1 Tax=Nerophis lumbriciformis TaxID=546530 RepID=UPI003BA97166